jgi:quercetin dioxygenase-like cupin family protein
MTTTDTGERRRPVVLGPGEGESVWFLNSRMTLKATGATTGGGYGLLESSIPPGFSPPMHVHHREDESFYVLEGQLRLQCGDETFVAEAGSYIFLPREVPHSFRVEGDTPARMLTIETPGGGERFFVDAGRPVEGEGLPDAAPVDVELLRRVGNAYGAEVVGPPLGAR